jgi:hypothetical protein
LTVAQRPDAKAAKTQATSFTRPAAERIVKVVRKVEAGDRTENALTFRRVGGGGGGIGLKLCTFTGAWAAGSSKVLTIANQTTTPNTVLATNLFLGLDPFTACSVLIGKAGSNWYLLQADLRKQPNYDVNASTQVFTIASGDMEWADVASCPDDEASPTSKALFFG